jgi:hypothetical protein
MRRMCEGSMCEGRMCEGCMYIHNETLLLHSSQMT